MNIHSLNKCSVIKTDLKGSPEYCILHSALTTDGLFSDRNGRPTSLIERRKNGSHYIVYPFTLID